MEAKEAHIPEAAHNQNVDDSPAADELVLLGKVVAANGAGCQAQEDGVNHVHSHPQNLEH